MIKAPQYLENILSDIKIIDECQLHAKIVIDGNNRFNIFTHGVEEVIKGAHYIMPNANTRDSYLKIAIRSTGGIDQHTLFDGQIHGYDNMFCDQHKQIARTVSLFELGGSSVFTGEITLGYSIEYEDEKEDYNVEGDDMVQVMNRDEKISWQQVKEEGYDWINIIFTNENGKTIEVDFELA